MLNSHTTFISLGDLAETYGSSFSTLSFKDQIRFAKIVSAFRKDSLYLESLATALNSKKLFVKNEFGVTLFQMLDYLRGLRQVAA